MQFNREIDVLIVGAGLSGLMTAVTLQQKGQRLALLEARSRIGGRVYGSGPSADDQRFDLGPAWFWPHQQEIIGLLQELNLQAFDQYETGHHLFERGPGAKPERFLPQANHPTYRIVGGTSALLNKLSSTLPPESIYLEHRVDKIEQRADHLRVTVNHSGETSEWAAKQVVVTLPPQLITASITFDPPLPTDLQRVMESTPTWMGEAMKVSLVYEQPFWRAAGLSGFAISYAGPVQQMHDATPADGSVGALFGWIGNHSLGRALDRSHRKQAIIDQAVKLFGPQAASLLHYAEINWEEEPFTTPQSLADRVTAQGHPRYGHPALLTPQMNGRLWWATTEAAPREGGYLDGAIFIGRMVAEQISAGSP